MSLSNQNIEQLIQQCSTGNQNAQFEIYNRYYKAMYNTSYRIVKDQFIAEDIMQDSFLTAFNKLKSLKERNTFGSWLKRIVINNSIQYYNKNSRYDEIPLDHVMCKVDDNISIESDYEFTNLKAKQVLETMTALKDNYRVALSLHLIEGYDYEEISNILNLSYANCRTTISRAKESLRQKLIHLKVS